MVYKEVRRSEIIDAINALENISDEDMDEAYYKEILEIIDRLYDIVRENF